MLNRIRQKFKEAAGNYRIVNPDEPHLRKNEKLAILHTHPHFNSYGSKKGKEWQVQAHEELYELFLPLPELRDIVEFYFANRVGIGALSSCHTLTSGIDNRYFGHLGDIKQLTRDYEIDIKFMEGWMSVRRKNDGERLILLHSQEVRTGTPGNEADVVAFGIGPLIIPGQPLEKTLEGIREYHGFSYIPHANSEGFSVGLDRAIDLYHQRKVNSIAAHNASENPHKNEELKKALNKAIIKGPYDPDGHYITQSLAAGNVVNKKIIDNFSMPLFMETLSRGDFRTFVRGSLDGPAELCTHKIPIITSIPFHFVAHPIKTTRTFGKIALEKYK